MQKPKPTEEELARLKARFDALAARAAALSAPYLAAWKEGRMTDEEAILAIFRTVRIPYEVDEEREREEASRAEREVMQPISPLITSAVEAAEQGRSYKDQLYLAQGLRYAVTAGEQAGFEALAPEGPPHARLATALRAAAAELLRTADALADAGPGHPPPREVTS